MAGRRACFVAPFVIWGGHAVTFDWLNGALKDIFVDFLDFFVFLCLIKQLLLKQASAKQKKNSRDSRDGGSRDVISITP